MFRLLIPSKYGVKAESADPLEPPMETYDDDPCASGGEYIGVALGNNSTTNSPAPAGTASFVFDVPAAGTYQVIVRLKMKVDGIDDDSAYARIDGATLSSTAGLVGGWIKWNNISPRVTGTNWHGSKSSIMEIAIKTNNLLWMQASTHWK